MNGKSNIEKSVERDPLNFISSLSSENLTPLSNETSPSALLSQQNAPQGNFGIKRIFISAVPLPGASGVPIFYRVDATKTLEKLHDFFNTYNIPEEQWVRKTVIYSTDDIGEELKNLPEYEQNLWKPFKDAILDTYRDYDTYVLTFSRGYLDSLCRVKVRTEEEIKTFSRKYVPIANALMKKQELDKYTSV